MVRESAVTDVSDTYRMYATIAADMAADETEPVRCASLLEMAQAWQRLADKAEESGFDRPPEPRVVLQQQQPQPDDDRK
jgi:hypothetical protein